MPYEARLSLKLIVTLLERLVRTRKVWQVSLSLSLHSVSFNRLPENAPVIKPSAGVRFPSPQPFLLIYHIPWGVAQWQSKGPLVNVIGGFDGKLFFSRKRTLRGGIGRRDRLRRSCSTNVQVRVLPKHCPDT